MDARKQVEEFAQDCIRCGICTRTDCGNFPDGTPSLGDIAESLLAGEDTFMHFPFTCALCGRCTVKCPKKLSAVECCKPLRALGLEKRPEMRPNYRHFRTDKRYNLFSLLMGGQKGDWTTFEPIEGLADLEGAANETAFFPGCSLGSYSPELTERSFAWLREQNLAAFKLNICCGATFFDTGFYPEFEEYRAGVVKLLADHGIKRVVVCCPHCAYVLPQTFADAGIELVRLPDLLLERGALAAGEGTYSVHDACYDRTDGVFGTAVRQLFEGWTEVPLAHTKEQAICCGGGGMVSAYAPDYCAYRRNMRLAEIDAVETDLVISTCFSCVNSMQRGSASAPVKHYLELVFGADVDWPQVYASVDAMYTAPEAQALLNTDEPMF